MLAGPLRRAVLISACWLAVFAAQADARLPAAPAALPQLWAVELDGAALRQLDRRVLERLRAQRVALVAATDLPAQGRRRLARLAARWELRAFRPLRAGLPAAACLARKQARPGTRCGARAGGGRAARRLSRARAADLVVVRAEPAGGLRRLDRAASARVLGVVSVSRRSAGGRRLGAALRAAARSTGLDLAVRPRGAGGRRALLRFVARLRRLSLGDRLPPPAPGGLRATGDGNASVALAWSRSKRARSVQRYGLYRDGRRLKSSARRSAVIRKLNCASHLLEVDAVDRAGNRSAKRFVSARPAGCSGAGDRPGGGLDPAGNEPGARGLPVPAPGPPPGFAHLWLDPDGGSCTRSDTPVQYGDGGACATAAQAYNVANATAAASTIAVKGGSYGGFSIRGRRGSTNWIEFEAAPGETPVFGGGYINLGDGDVAGGAVDYVALRNLTTAEFGAGAANPDNRGGVYVAPHSTNVRLEGMRAGNFLVQAARNVAVVGGQYGPCRASDGGQECEINKVDHYPGAPQPDNILIDGVHFHDYDLGPSCFSIEDGGTSTGNPDCHWRPMYLNGVHHLTLRNSRFRDSFIGPWTTISGPEAARAGNRSILIENNVFGTGINYGNPSHLSKRGYGRWESFDLAWCQNVSAGVPAYESVWYRFNSGSRVVGPFILFSEVGCSPDSIRDVRVYGNVGYRNGCDALVDYAFNVWSNGGRCDDTDRNANAGGALPFYGADTHSPGPDDFRLARPGPADGLVPASAGCPAADRFGNPRGAGGVCDAGSHER